MYQLFYFFYQVNYLDLSKKSGLTVFQNSILFVTNILFSFPLRGGSRTVATSKMESFVIIINDFKPLTIITKRSILDVAAVLDPPLPLY